MKRAFRLQLAVRFTVAMAATVIGLGILSFVAIRHTLDSEIDATLLNVASLQAGSAAHEETGRMRLHEWELTAEEAASIRDLNRYAQIWAEDGTSLLRTRYLTADLPLDPAALARAVAGELAWTEHTYASVPIRSIYYPLGRFGVEHDTHVLQVAAPLEARNRTLRSVALLLLLTAVVVPAGTFAGSWWLAGRAVRPVHEIIDQAEEIGAATLGRRITAYAESEEYHRLVEVLNTMLARLERVFQAQKRFTADAGHELRSPLTALRGELELALRRDREPAEYRRVIGSSLEEVERLSRTAEDLLTLARSDAGVIEPALRLLDPAELVERVLARLRPLAEQQGVQLASALGAGHRVYADADLMERMIWNLAENALKFSDPGTRVAISITGDADEVVLEVADQGPGIAAGDDERIFEPFYRADLARTRSESGGGSGLGLAIVRALARAHDARVSAANGPARGAVFRLIFPAANAPIEP